MKFLLDEGAEYRLATLLRADGHDVTAITHDYQRSLDDEDVLAIARAEQRIVITNDRDFGELVIRHGLPHAGVIFFRLGAGSSTAKHRWIRAIIADFPDELDQFFVVTHAGIRVHRMQ